MTAYANVPNGWYRLGIADELSCLSGSTAGRIANRFSLGEVSRMCRAKKTSQRSCLNLFSSLIPNSGLKAFDDPARISHEVTMPRHPAHLASRLAAESR